MASKGEAGIELILDQVPAREEGMTPYEFMLSESQERMLMVLKPGREGQAQAIFEKWGLDAAVIGHTTDTGNLTLKWHGQTVCDIPLGPLADEAPKYERPYVQPLKAIALTDGEHKRLSDEFPGFANSLSRLMAEPDQASKRWIWEQYDRHVQGDTLADSGSDAAIVRLYGSRRALAMTCDVTPRYVEADAYEGGKQAVAEAWRNLTAVGAKPLAVTDNLNFGNPERPEIMGQFVGCVRGIAAACTALDFPVVSGNVSLYNETNGRAILPTPTIGGVGVLNDFTKSMSLGFKNEGDAILLIGENPSWLGQSLYLREICGREEGAPPPVDLEVEKRHGEFVRHLIAESQVTAVHDISDGGLLVALAEMAMAGKLGATLVAAPSDMPAQAFWFGEDQARYVVTVKPGNMDAVVARATAAGISVTKLGVVGGDVLAIEGERVVPVAKLTQAFEGWLPAYMAASA
jgi:phosphoribosylformylglycinamidine synthase